jgi:hypothetical protein
MQGDEEPMSSARDDRLIARIAAAYAPRRLEPARRVALEQELWTRIEKRKCSAGFRPVAAAVTFAAAVLWFAPAWLGTEAATPETSSPALVVAAADVDAWEYDILYPDDAPDAALEVVADDERLPEDYRAIEDLLAGG